MTSLSEEFSSAVHHHRAGRLVEADALCRHILAAEPDNSSALHLLGIIATETGQHRIAIAMIQKAISANDRDASFHVSLAEVHRTLWQLDDAAASCRRALALDPTSADAHYNLGSVLYRQGKLQAAMESLRYAITYQPDHARAHDRLGCAYLMMGNFNAGWPEYEWRWSIKSFATGKRGFAQAQWRGEPLNGDRILLHAEQGFGDTLQFVRYAPMVAARGGRVILEVQLELHRLLRNTPGTEMVIVRGETRPDFAWHCPLLSLPLAFATELATIPNKIPYIRVDPAEIRSWTSFMQGTEFRVGINWAGNPKQKWDQVRSPRELSIFAPLSSVKGITYFSLQKGEAAPQAQNPPSNMKVVDLSPHHQTFADTAAAIMALDLVITSDTSVAHLAGALGKPVWILLAHVADWIWLTEREDSPWYPTVRLFRQPTPGAWVSVIERVVGELRRLSEGDRSVLRPRPLENLQALDGDH